MTEPTAPVGTTELTEAEAAAVAMGDYTYGWSKDDSAAAYAFKSERGLTEQTVRGEVPPFGHCLPDAGG